MAGLHGPLHFLLCSGRFQSIVVPVIWSTSKHDFNRLSRPGFCWNFHLHLICQFWQKPILSRKTTSWDFTAGLSCGEFRLPSCRPSPSSFSAPCWLVDAGKVFTCGRPLSYSLPDFVTAANSFHHPSRFLRSSSSYPHWHVNSTFDFGPLVILQCYIGCLSSNNNNNRKDMKTLSCSQCHEKLKVLIVTGQKNGLS